MNKRVNRKWCKPLGNGVYEYGGKQYRYIRSEQETVANEYGSISVTYWHLEPIGTVAQEASSDE